MAILERFDSLRTELAQSLTALQAIVARSPHPEPRLDQSLRDIHERLAGQRFVLVVLGEFKRGKTTLINSLIGQELLPAAVVPLTSVTTVLEYGEDRLARAQFLDGTYRTVAIDEIASYVTERENPHNERQVARVRISVPCEFLKGGVELVDTPGVGSVYAHNTQAAYEFVPQADAGIFIVSADPPISEGERRFLADVRPFLARIFFVQNKIDQLPPKEQAESLAFTREVIEGETGVPETVIYPLSAREALEANRHGDQERLDRSGLPAFETALSRFLMREKGDVALGSGLKRALHVAAELSNTVQIQQEALRTPLADLEKAAETFQQELKAIRQEQRDARARLWVEAERTIIGRAFEEERERTREAALQAITAMIRDTAAREGNAGPRQLHQILNQVVAPAVEKAVREWQMRMEPELKAALEQLCSGFTERINEITQRALALVQHLFGLSLKPLAPPPPLEASSQFIVRQWAVILRPGDIGGLWLYLLPRPWARQRILRGAERLIAVALEMHLGLAAADLRDRVRASVDAYLHVMNDTVARTTEGMHRAIQRALEQQRQGEATVAAVLDQLAADAAALVGVDRQLRSLLDRWESGTERPTEIPAEIGSQGALVKAHEGRSHRAEERDAPRRPSGR